MAKSSKLTLTSTAFLSTGMMPERFTCDGAEVSPQLSISGAPDGTRSFVLIMRDPDVPKITRKEGVFLHWLLFDIPAETAEIPEGESAGTPGMNTEGTEAYVGPCPPPQYDPPEHRYIFTLCALDTMLNFPRGATEAQVLAAMEGHVLGQAELMGRYQRRIAPAM